MQPEPLRYGYGRRSHRVGPGVKDFKAGDKVVTYLGLEIGCGLAEYVVAEESMTVVKPPEVSAADAAALPVTALTAHQALTDSAEIKLDGSGKTPKGAALKSPFGVKYDVVIHCTSDIPWSTFEPNLSTEGKVTDLSPNLISYLIFKAKFLTFSKKQLAPIIIFSKRENIDFLVNLAKEGL
ncbi:hypothetical protein SLEP1_g577 [Rubroshorea leprosula]|uniref:Uncharacterized protein n=1 Tax=Rubroshorea leprosula TaxID=152421 RepID=A0AAV5HGU0_9ROSI|nr:hypothetical protein SLEP1_g577 [Rubroshorea leprosula]